MPWLAMMHAGALPIAAATFLTSQGVPDGANLLTGMVSPRMSRYCAGTSRGFLGAPPFHTLHVHDRHLLGLQHDVIEGGRRRHHLLVVEADGDVAPGALDEVFFKQFDAGVFYLLRDGFQLVGVDGGRLFGCIQLFALLRRLLGGLVFLAVFELVDHVLEPGFESIEVLSAALLLGEEIAVG